MGGWRSSTERSPPLPGTWRTFLITVCAFLHLCVRLPPTGLQLCPHPSVPSRPHSLPPVPCRFAHPLLSDLSLSRSPSVCPRLLHCRSRSLSVSPGDRGNTFQAKRASAHQRPNKHKRRDMGRAIGRDRTGPGQQARATCPPDAARGRLRRPPSSPAVRRWSTTCVVGWSPPSLFVVVGSTVSTVEAEWGKSTAQGQTARTTWIEPLCPARPAMPKKGGVKKTLSIDSLKRSSWPGRNASHKETALRQAVKPPRSARWPSRQSVSSGKWPLRKGPSLSLSTAQGGPR